jgi:hypothetical protein
MNEFIKKMLELGAELDQSTTGIEANLVINDAEILYKNHIKQLTLTGVSHQRELLKAYTKWLDDKLRDSDELDELMDDYFRSL